VSKKNCAMKLLTVVKRERQKQSEILQCFEMCRHLDSNICDVPEAIKRNLFKGPSMQADLP
jgi:hypothetical protein